MSGFWAASAAMEAGVGLVYSRPGCGWRRRPGSVLAGRSARCSRWSRGYERRRRRRRRCLAHPHRRGPASAASCLFRPWLPRWVDAGKVVAEDVGGAAAVGAVHDEDRRAGQDDLGVEGRDGGVVPVGDLPEEDPRDYRAGELQPGQAEGGCRRRFGTEVDGDLHGGAAVGGCLLGGGHGHIGGAEVGLLAAERRDARAAADRGVGDRHARVLLLVCGERLVEERRVECRPRTERSAPRRRPRWR